ncbi:MAG: pilus assembly protein PilZ [Spirochaetales bacterium]|nr:pilus assembly protein PilZ [Spirochaetales bacterium]
MKILLVADKDSTRETLLKHLKPRGLDLIHYRNPIKAMDNIDEIEPDLVFFSAEDFPRHWKPFIQLMRESFTSEQTFFVLLKGEVFSFDEAAKAQHLEVNGIIKEDLEDRKEFRRLEELLVKYSRLEETRDGLRYIPEDHDKLEFVFSHPETFALITGAIFDLSETGIAFDPDDAVITQDIQTDAIIQHATLKIEDDQLACSCIVVRNDGRLVLHFVDLAETQQDTIVSFIERKPERELKSALRADVPQL